MYIEDEDGVTSPEASPMEAEAERLSGGLLNIRLVRTEDTHRGPSPQ